MKGQHTESKIFFERSLSTSQLPRLKKRQNSRCNFFFKKRLFYFKSCGKVFPLKHHMVLAGRNLIYAFTYLTRKEKYVKEIRIRDLRLRERLHIYHQYKNQHHFNMTLKYIRI